MAENKKGFILYADLIYTLEKLPNEKAGELFKHILRYVNDLNPITNDILIDVTFEQLKQQLKRDLRKYEEKKVQWSKAGKASAESKRLIKLNGTQQNSTDVENCSTESTVIVNVKDNVTVNVKDINTNTKYWARPCDFLKQNEIEFEQLQMKSGVQDFEQCLEQWSLSVEGSDFAYSENKHEDYRKLTARFKKWINSWRINKAEKSKPKPEKIPESVRLGKAKLVEVNGQMLVKPLNWQP